MGEDIGSLPKRDRVLIGIGALCALVALFAEVRAYSEDAFLQLTATFLGATLAIVSGVWLLHRGEKIRKRREELREALIAELYATRDRLNTKTVARFPDPDKPDDRNKVVVVVLAHLEPTVTEETINSALFGHDSTNSLTYLARLMREYTKNADILRVAYYRPQWEDPKQIYVLAMNVKRLQTFVLDFCDAVLKGFEARGVELPPEERYFSDPRREAPPDFGEPRSAAIGVGRRAGRPQKYYAEVSEGAIRRGLADATEGMRVSENNPSRQLGE